MYYSWHAGIAQLVEHNLAKVGVGSSNLLSRSSTFKLCYLKFYFLVLVSNYARVVELVDTGDLKSPDHCDRAGSSPAPGTI